MKLKQYLYSQLGLTFFPIFLGLYFITSIIFLVKIASLTSIITMNFSELLTLYVYVIPNILFYTLPISFFLSLVITLSKLSSEYELIVITSFGLNPMKILKIFLPITFFLSISLIIISVGLIPKTKYLTNTLLEQKKKEANFNIKASEYGQKFGDWFIYINSRDKKTYEEVKLFKTDKGVDQFIIAKNADLNNKDGNLSFMLNNGKSFHIDNEKIYQIDFLNMSINDSISVNQGDVFTNVYEYWKKRIVIYHDEDNLIFYVLTSLFPFFSLLFVISFGYFNPRYDKNRSVMLGMFATVLYYVSVDYLAKNILFNALIFVPLIWVVLSYLIYRRSVKKVY